MKAGRHPTVNAIAKEIQSTDGGASAKLENAITVTTRYRIHWPKFGNPTPHSTRDHAHSSMDSAPRFSL